MASYATGPYGEVKDADLKMAKSALDKFMSFFAQQGKIDIDVERSKMNFYEHVADIHKECELLRPLE
jgi:hypothetical protein